MKKLVIILAIGLVSLQAYSQIKFGLKVAAATTTVPTYDVSSGSSNIDAVKNSSWGWQAGGLLRFNLAMLYIQPEVLFATTSYDYNVTTSTVTEVVSQKFNRLSIPILVGIHLGPLRINAGPAASISIGSPDALIDDPNFEDMYKGALWGYQVGVGIDLFKRLTLDARYAGGLGDKTGDSVPIGGQTFKLDYGQQSFILSAGIIF